MIIELQDEHPDFPPTSFMAMSHACTRRLIENQAYDWVHRDAINSVYVNRERMA